MTYHIKFLTRTEAEAEIACINELIEDLHYRIDELKDELESLVQTRDEIEEQLDDLEDDEDEEIEEAA